MVMIMNENKDPRQKNSSIDSDDDDEIIELTELVVRKSKDDAKIADTGDIGAAASQKAAEIPVETDKTELEAEDAADLSDSDESPATESHTDTEFFDLSKLDSDDAGSVAEDVIIASQVEASLGDDDDDLQEDPVGRTDEPEPISEQDTESHIDTEFFDLSELDSDDAGFVAKNDIIASQFEASLGDDDDDLQEDPVGRTDEPEPISEQDTESHIDTEFFDLSELDSDDAGFVAENDIIASQFEASLGDDADDLQEDPVGRTDEPEPISEHKDDVIILNTEDKDPAALPDPGEPVTEKNEAVFDSEEEIELAYESDEDEYDFFALDDNQTFQEPETIAMADEDHDDALDESIFFNPTENLELSSDEDNEILTMDADPKEAAGLIALDDEDPFLFGDNDDLPDLTEEMEFAIDAEDDENGLDTADDQPAEDSDDIIARTVEKSLAPGEVTAQIDLAMLPEFEFTEDNETMTEDDQQATPENLAATTMEKIRVLAEEDDLPEIDDDINLEFEDDEDEAGIDEVDELELEEESLPREDFDESAAGEEDEIVEITEFDRHFPEEDEKLLELSSILGTAKTDEYSDLELIEVEEDDPADDEKVADVRSSEEQNDEKEIDRFFSENLENEMVFENEESEAVEEIPTLSTDMAMATALTDDEDDKIDFRLDSSEISDQVDRLDTFLSEDSTAEPEIAALSEEPEVAALFEEPSAEKDTADDHKPAFEETIQSLPVTPDQIEAVLERIISDKLGGKIEGIIYEVIEKAVSKEIDRLKGALLDNAGRGDIG